MRKVVFDRVFSKYKPDLVFATDVFDLSDGSLVVAASQHGTQTVGMVRSWDNPTTKGVLLAVPEHLVVHSEVLRDELVSIHHIRADHITVTGIPHQDAVVTWSPASRDMFFSELGLDSKKKTILFAPGGRVLYRHDGELLALLKRLRDAGEFGDVQFLVRCPPGDQVNTIAVDSDSHFIVDLPGTRLTKRKKDSELSPSDNTRLMNSLFHSDVILTIVSSMAIDGTIFDKPVIIIGFDPPGALTDTVSKFGTNPHFKKFLDTGLVTVSRSADELVEMVQRGLKTPNWNKAERDALVKKYAYRLDGHAAERVADAVLAHLG